MNTDVPQNQDERDEAAKWERLNALEDFIQEYILDRAFRDWSIMDYAEDALDEAELQEYRALYKELIEDR
jgi:hypothetical protein